MPKKEYNYVRKVFSYNGRRYEVYGETEEDAIKKKLEKLRELDEGTASKNTTVKQWARIWMETYIKPRGLTEKSLTMYTSSLDKVILPAIGAQKLRDITPTQLKKILNTRAGMSFSHANHLRIVIRAMFRQAYIDRHIPFDPAAALELPKTTKGSHRSMTDEERSALLSVAEKPEMHCEWLLCILYCGLRPGEVAALRWKDVDLDNSTLHIKRSREGGTMRFKAPKTEAGIRDVPIPKVFIGTLRGMPQTAEYVFTQKDGKTPLSESSMRRRWETVKKYMDIALGAEFEMQKPEGKRKHSLVITKHVLDKDLDMYDLRHTYCTDLEKKGVPINIAKDFMGHSDISVTGNIYTHADQTTLELGRKLIDG